MWGVAADHKIGQRTSSGWKLSQVVFKQIGLIWSQGFIPGETICIETSASSLVAPIF
jgi:hypothetical protein